MIKGLIGITMCLFVSGLGYSQDDLMSMLEEETPEENAPVIATWKTMKLVNLHSTEMVKKNALDFRVTHRFGNIGKPSGGGGHNLWGLDNSADIRISFDYGLTENLQIGVGRSKYNELIDGSVKYRLLRQKEKKVPVTMVVYGCAGITPKKDIDGRYANGQNRLSYVTQLLIARKFGDRFSLEIAPTYTHRNLVERVVDGNGNILEDENDLFSIGAGARFKITKRLGLIADYVFTSSSFRQNYSPKKYYAPLGVGVEIETGGHVFHITLTNAAGIMENNYIPVTTDSWENGGMKLGFNISRTFQF